MGRNQGSRDDLERMFPYMDNNRVPLMKAVIPRATGQGNSVFLMYRRVLPDTGIEFRLINGDVQTFIQEYRSITGEVAIDYPNNQAMYTVRANMPAQCVYQNSIPPECSADVHPANGLVDVMEKKGLRYTVFEDYNQRLSGIVCDRKTFRAVIVSCYSPTGGVREELSGAPFYKDAVTPPT